MLDRSFHGAAHRRVVPAMAACWGQLLLCLMTACSGSGEATSDGSADGPKADVAGGDVAMADISCNQLRLCAAACSDVACVEACERRGSVAGRTLFEAYSRCVVDRCDDVSDITCYCESSCFAESPCSVETEACTQSETDLVCDELCH